MLRAQIAERDAWIKRFEDDQQAMRATIEDLNAANAEQSKEVLAAIGWLRDLAGIAAKDQRGSRD